MGKIGIYNEDGEPMGFDYVYDDDDPGDPYDDYDNYEREYYDVQEARENGEWYEDESEDES